MCLFVRAILFSEPPDIRNWFSSYVYESSVSDTCSLIKDVVSEENECEEDKFDFEVINEDEDRPENVHTKQCVQHNSPSDENKRVKQPSSRVLILWFLFQNISVIEVLGYTSHFFGI